MSLGSVPPRAREMTPAEVAVFETFVVPRYLSLFGERLLDQLVLGSDAQVIHVHCRTGYPDRAIVSLLADAHVYGVDASPAALELARTKATQKAGMVSEYKLFEGYPIDFPAAAFSHGLSLHPLAAPREQLGTAQPLAAGDDSAAVDHVAGPRHPAEPLFMLAPCPDGAVEVVGECHRAEQRGGAHQRGLWHEPGRSGRPAGHVEFLRPRHHGGECG